MVINYTEFLEQQLPKFLTRSISNLNKERENENKAKGVDEELRFFIKTDTNYLFENRKRASLINLFKQNFETNQENSQAKNLLSEHNMNTHFKGASNLAMINSNIPETPRLPKIDKMFNARIIGKSSLNASIKPQKNFTQSTFAKNNDKIASLLNEEINKHLIKSIKLLYNDNTNKILNDKNTCDKD